MNNIKYNRQLDAVNAMIAELGIDVDTATSPQLVATGPRPGVSTGPGTYLSHTSSPPPPPPLLLM